MKLLSKILSVIVGLTVINVWLFRSGKETAYRGGDAGSLMDEFVVYGLGDYFLTIGIIKVGDKPNAKNSTPLYCFWFKSEINI